MADAAMIAAVSEWILDALQNRMCPRLFSSREEIKLISPDAKDAGYTLGLCLYDISGEAEASQAPLTEARRARRQKPPKPYSLYYMAFLNAASHSKLREADKYRILGEAAQAVNDCGAISPNRLQPWLETEEPPITLSQARLGFADKVAVRRAMNQTWQASLFYKAAPVFLSCDSPLEPPRVREVTIDVKEAEERRQKNG